MAGANEQKLRGHLASSRVWQVLQAESQWRQGAQALADVAKAIEQARPLARENLGQHTADQADKAFVAMHEKVKQRQEQLKKGAEALAQAKEAITRAQAVVSGFEREGDLPEPSPPDWADDEIKQIQQLKVHNSRMSAYNNAVAAREEAARAAIQDVDDTNRASTATMREIQGKPPVDNGGGGAGGGTPAGGSTTAPPAGTSTRPPGYDPVADDDPPGTPDDPPTDGTDDPPPDHSPSDSPAGDPGQYESLSGEDAVPADGAGNPTVLTTPSSGTAGGMAGALGGGLVGGAVGMGAIRGAAAAAGAPASAARPIGSTGRSAAPGALGRSSAAGGTPARGAGAGAARGTGAGAGRGTAARGAGGRVGAGGAGGRGAAGARGSGARAAGAGAGRAGRSREEQDQQVDHLLDDQDWIDDEVGAPGVID
jgi:hypothetical protein